MPEHTLSVLILYYAGKNADDEDTLEGVKGIAEALTRLKYPVQKFRVTEKNWEQAVKIPADVVFNFVEDETWTLYEKVGRALEKVGRAQVGHDIECFAYAVNKVAIKKKLKLLHLPTPRFQIITKKTDLQNLHLHFPIILKPSHQHAGIGISQTSVVKNNSQLVSQIKFIQKQFPEELIAEEYIPGREIHVTIIGNGNQLIVLPLCEIGFLRKFKKNWSVYTYKAKWDKKSWEYWDARVSAPAKMPVSLTDKIKKIATNAYKGFHLRDIARFDVRVDTQGNPFIIDVNTNPSLNVYDTEDATIASVKAYHWTYDHFIKTLVGITFGRVN